MKITVQCVGRLEVGIRPPMPLSVTIPIDVDGQREPGYTVYVTCSAFGGRQPTPNQMEKVGREVARRLAQETSNG